MLPEALQKASSEQVVLELGQPQLVQRPQKPGSRSISLMGPARVCLSGQVQWG
jgi:hypothetical protein